MISRLGTVLCVPLLACGGDSNNKNIVLVDASSVDVLPSACKAQPSYATLETGGFGYDSPAIMMGSANYAHQQYGLEPLSSTDALYLELNGQFGGFGSGDIMPGTFPIAGAELEYNTCGVCVQLWPQSVDASGHVPVTANYLANERYMATSGTVTLTMAGGGSGSILAGSLANVAFQHVMIGAGRAQNYSPDDCSSTLGSGSFSIVLMMSGSAAFR
jgi:hypothetical protein